MADIQLLGLFHDVEQVTSAISQVRKAGLKDSQFTVLSNHPINHEILGRAKPATYVTRMALIGAILGALTAFALVAGTGQLYPLSQGNQPIIPIPPLLIVTFEVTMLGTMWMAFFGMLLSNKFPVFKKQVYSPRITGDSIGLLVEMDEKLADEIKKIFNDNQAHEIQQQGASQAADPGAKRFWWSVVAVLVAAGGVTGLFVYDIIHIPFPSQMVDQVSIGEQQGPRLAAPVAAIPVQGRVLVNGLPQTNPVAATSDSLQRGKIFFSINCEMCHGSAGAGDGKLVKSLDNKPADLSSSKIQSLADDDIFLVINQGFGTMPSMAENLDSKDYWDVINYVRTLKK